MEIEFSIFVFFFPRNGIIVLSLLSHTCQFSSHSTSRKIILIRNSSSDAILFFSSWVRRCYMSRFARTKLKCLSAFKRSLLKKMPRVTTIRSLLRPNQTWLLSMEQGGPNFRFVFAKPFSATLEKLQKVKDFHLSPRQTHPPYTF